MLWRILASSPVSRGNLHWLVSDSRAHLAVSQAAPFFPLIRLPEQVHMDSEEEETFVPLASAAWWEYYNLHLQGTSRTSVPSLARGRGGRHCDSVTQLSHCPGSSNLSGATVTTLLPQSCACTHFPACRRLFSSGTEVPALVHLILKLGWHSPSHGINVKAFLWKKKVTVPTKTF